jgi:MFS superfamily sulfate permease-like transporter
MKNLSFFNASAWSRNGSEIKTDIIAGFIIFLIALPLSIGISVASGAPPSAGILAAIVGGVLGSLVSGSYVTISGPAAGLIVVILDAITALGHGNAQVGFRLTLAAIIVAGLVQILMGYFKAGTIALAVPLNALQGMLSSIGLIIMIKQVFVLEGISAHSKSILMQVVEIPQRVSENNLEIFLIGMACLAIVILFNYFPKLNKVFPAPLAAVAVGYAFSIFVDIAHPHSVDLINQHFEVGPNFLLKVPENIKDFFIFPLFENLMTLEFIIAVITIALVGSIESVLSTAAIDKLDPQHRESDLNMDLISKGLCNTFLGFIGGIPVISEIVRSSANITNGAKSRWSNLFHGLFIALFILFATSVLNQIPLAAFAAILIYVGFKLTNPFQLKNIFKMGWDQLFVFLGTILMTLATDLLIGILFGTLLNLVFNMIQSKSFIGLFILNKTIVKNGSTENVKINSACVFSNVLSLKKTIEKSTSSKLVIEFSPGTFVDISSQLMLKNLKNKMQQHNKEVTYVGLNFLNIEAGH